jgi:hypothetical protein
MRETEKQVWFCEQCQRVSFTMMNPGIDAWSAVEVIGQAHRRLSPQCPYGMRDLMIINEEIITTYEKLVAESRVPRWAIAPLAQVLGFTTQLAGGETVSDADCCGRCNRRVGRETLTRVSLNQGRQVLSVCTPCKKEFLEEAQA